MSKRAERAREVRYEGSCSGELEEDAKFYSPGRGLGLAFSGPLGFHHLQTVPAPIQAPPRLRLVMSVIFYWKLIVWGVWGFWSRQE